MYTDAFVPANLDALARAQGVVPGLARPDDAIRLLPQPDGTVRLETLGPDGAWAPETGASLHGVESDDVVVVGAGDGRALAAWLDAGPSRRALIVEPDPGLALLLLASRDWTSWITGGRVGLLTAPDCAGGAGAGRVLRGEPAATLVVDPRVAARRPAETAIARRTGERLAREAATNARARRKLAGPYLLQTLGNLPRLAAEAEASSLAGLFTDCPIVLVAAGPSLDRTLPDLRRLQDRALIVAADTTLRPLLRGGVRPHLMVSIDPSDLNGQHLSDVPDVDDIHLAAEGSLHPRALTAFAGRVFTFRISDHEPWRWLRGAGLDVMPLRAWGSVATAGFDLALTMGASMVIFTGHDFAYSGNRPYCDNTRFHDEWRAYLANNPGTIEHYEDLMMNGRPTVEVPDIHGAPVRTGTQLIAYKEWVVDRARTRADVRFLNATGGGILQAPHITQTSLEAALDGAPAVRDPRGRLRAAWQRTAGRLGGVGAALRALDGEPASSVWRDWGAFTLETVEPATLRAAVAEAAGRSCA